MREQRAVATQDLELTEPVVLAIRRGGIEVAALIAPELDAERSIIIMDNWIATGSSMIAALRARRKSSLRCRWRRQISWR